MDRTNLWTKWKETSASKTSGKISTADTIVRLEDDKKKIDRISNLKNRLLAMKRSVFLDAPVDSTAIQKKEILDTLLSGINKVLSLKKKAVKRCIVLTAVSIGIFAGAMSVTTGTQNIPGLASINGGAFTGPPIHQSQKLEEKKNYISNFETPIQCLISTEASSQRPAHPVTSLILRFGDGQRMCLEASITAEKELYEHAAGKIMEKYNIPPEGAGILKSTIVNALEKFDKERLFGQGGGYMELSMKDMISASIAGIEKRVGEKTVVDAMFKKDIVTKTIESRILHLLKNKDIEHKEEKAARYAKAIYAAHRQYGINPFILAGIMERESAGIETAVSPTKQGYGLMQVNWTVHKRWVPDWFSNIRTLEDVMKPENNVLVGTAIYAGALKRNRGNHEKALFEYLGGTNPKYAEYILNIAGTLEKNSKLMEAMIKKHESDIANANKKNLTFQQSDVFI